MHGVHASLACTAMITRCMAVHSGTEVMCIQAMPRMLVTQFTAIGTRTSPPSRFEFFAAKTASSRGGNEYSICN